MPAELSLSAADLAQQLAAERARRKQAEHELAEARVRLAVLGTEPVAAGGTPLTLNAQLSALMQNLRLGLVLVDPDGQAAFVSAYFWRLFGVDAPSQPPPYAPDQLRIAAAFADPAAFQARVWALHRAGRTTLGERFVLRDGRVLELDYLVLDAEQAGRLICYRDITSQLQYQQQLDVLAALPEQNPNPVLRFADAGQLLYANPAAVALTQLLHDDPAGDFHQQLLGLMQLAQRQPLPTQQELVVPGSHYLVTVAVPTPNNFTLYLTDVTERQQALQQLAEQRAFYESVLEQVPVSLAVLDEQHRYQFVNSTLEPDASIRAWMLGKSSEEVGRYRQRPEQVIAQRSEAFNQAISAQREVTWEEVCSDGEQLRHFLHWYRPMPAPPRKNWVISVGIDVTEQKLAEEKVVRQQEFYESILNLLPFDVAVFDADHRYLFVNPAAVSKAEVRQQILGLTNAEYFRLRPGPHPELAEQREQYFALAVRTATDVTWEEMRTDHQGRPQLMVRHLRPVFAPDGTLRLVVGSGVDITPRYLAERLQQQVQERLREQEAFIRLIVDTVPNGLYLVEPNGDISFSNIVFDKQIARAQHLRPGPRSVQVQQELEAMRELNTHVLRTGQAITREMPLTLTEGRVEYFSVHKKPLLRAGGEVGILTISTNITDVKRARQELERREKQYHDLVYYSQALICTHDLAGIILSVNPAIERLLGWPAAELLGRSLSSVVPPAHQPAFEAYLAGLQTPNPHDRLIAIQTRAGERRYLRYNSYPVAEAGYRPYVVASGYDVTTGVLAQRALEQAKREAEDNAQAKETFLARMSHEIRTPLNGVLGMASLLHKTALTPQQTEYLHAMQQAGQHLLHLLNDVLDMAKITAQHLHLNTASFNLAEVLQRAGQAVAAVAETRGLALTVQPLAPAALAVVGDAYRLHQVLLNLLANAIKFTERGEVRLGVDIVRETSAELDLRFWVRDTGIGIPPDEQAHIFDAFAQASPDTSTRFGGTGLGLAISQQLIGQMGGVLRMCSEVGVGSTFAFRLRLLRAAPARPADAAPRPVRSFEALRGLRVLLAEDNLVNQWIARVVLEHWGVQVQAVPNGIEAFALLREQAFDAAILDIRMPGLSGVEVTAALRGLFNPERANIPIIALTANAFESERLTYIAAGMNACLTKPYEEADLCQLLLELSGRGHAAGSELPNASAK